MSRSIFKNPKPTLEHCVLVGRQETQRADLSPPDMSKDPELLNPKQEKLVNMTGSTIHVHIQNVLNATNHKFRAVKPVLLLRRYDCLPLAGLPV
jgi:hypothetical protein